MRIIEIETKEMEKASEYVEKALKYMGKVMQCISSWEDEAYGERGVTNYRNEDDEHSRSMMGGYKTHGMRGDMNYRDEEWDDEINERRSRRRRDSMGRYR